MVKITQTVGVKPKKKTKTESVYQMELKGNMREKLVILSILKLALSLSLSRE